MVEIEESMEQSQPGSPVTPQLPPQYEDIVKEDQAMSEMEQNTASSDIGMERNIQPSQEQFDQVRAALCATQLALQQSDNNLTAVTKLWKKAATELDTLRSQRQGFYQMTDDYLITLIKQLRYNIRSFAIQYFGDEPQSWMAFAPEAGSNLGKRIMAATTPGSNAFNDYLESHTRCPSIIQAFLWNFLKYWIFNCAYWAGDGELHEHIFELCRGLNPKYLNLSSLSSHEQVRKFQAWRASTTGLVLDLLATSNSANPIPRIGRNFARMISEAIAPFFRTRPDGHLEILSRIIQEAIYLDREISSQVAQVEWTFRPDTTNRPINFSNQEGIMELEQGERVPVDGSPVCLVIAPGVKKRGRSTGEGFDEEVWLMPMEVTCAKMRCSSCISVRRG
ncbi:hypothetical protein VP1G_05586 [Cytospora mali]|uniref:Uncharacterized protein n=1 Tax=Cytospora mali TaxID=578113 RepID=A0A194V349_CYTMA|nr:hypothetical protein VP1G_05586 [Valsa mali var. pyri (nom. inval.)]